jgi:hypothetical protein
MRTGQNSAGKKNTFLAKDTQGNKSNLDLWNLYMSKVEIGLCYQITNIKVSLDK